ncbi:MAG: hypothetical protein N2037_11440 [Acidimicrobiales bacterium]|nr:hypothetical protein [Acidimicrobiales bacterium]
MSDETRDPQALRAVALITAAFSDDDLEPELIASALAPDLADEEDAKEIIFGFVALCGWLLDELESATGVPGAQWLNRAGLAFS